MDALAAINREDGITVLVNLHSLDIAKRYCGRIIGLSSGHIVFDGPPATLNAATERNIYGTGNDDTED